MPTVEKKIDPELLPHYEEWLSTQELPEIDTKEVRAIVRDDLKFAKSMPVKEYTLWQKWDEIQTEFSDASKSEIAAIKKVKRKVWGLNYPDDYLKLEPELVFTQTQFPVTSVSIWGHERFEFFTNPDPLSDDWEKLRIFVSTMPYGGNIGRSLRFLVRDRRTKKYLGVICISSDFFELPGRDEAIGWTRQQKINEGMIKHTAIGSVIVPTQPFGFNYVGGKLLALLCLSNTVADMWEQIYGDKLVGVSTTSLYDQNKTASQYDGLKHWKKYGRSPGEAPIKLSKTTQYLMREWLKCKHPFDYWQFHVATRESGMPLVTNANARSTSATFSKLGFRTSDWQSSHPRGIYFSKLYSNTFEFLCQEIDGKDLKPAFDNSTDYLVNLWREKYAKKRIESLEKKDRINASGSFYDELLSLSWDQTRERFPHLVGA